MLGGQAEFGINWLASLLATRDKGQNIVNIAQVFTLSGMTEVTWKDSGLDQITDLRGKQVGVWINGNEHKSFAALNKNGIDPQKDAEVFAQPFDMEAFLKRQIDAAAAMTYNEPAQVLETKDPDTGQLHTIDQLNVMKMSDLGHASRTASSSVSGLDCRGRKRDVAKRFLKASFRGQSIAATTRTSA